MNNYGYCPVAHDTHRYYEEADRAEARRRQECIDERDHYEREMLGVWGFVAEKIADQEATNAQVKRILNGLRGNDDAEIGAAVRELVTSALKELLDDVTEGVAHEGSMEEMLRWWRA